MAKLKGTKRALIFSFLALITCFSMFVGSTYAWFSDSVTSTGNKIQSGTLQVDLEIFDERTNNWASLKTSDSPIFNYDKWEPGYTEIKLFKIENEGSLSLKWMAKFVPVSALSGLADVIDVYILSSQTELTIPQNRDLSAYTRIGTIREFISDSDFAPYGTLQPNNVQYLSIAFKMHDNASNSYQNLELGAFDMVVLATQASYENDTFGKDYDEETEYPEYVSVIKVTPENAQAVLDSASDYTVIKLSPGSYGTLTVDEGALYKKETASNTLVPTVPLDMYSRTIKSLTIIGCDGATVKGINVISQRVFEISDTRENAPAHYVRLYADSLTFKDINFNGSGLTFNLYEGSSTCSSSDLGNVKNVTVDNCSFTGDYGVRVINNYSVDNNTSKHKPINLAVNGSVFKNIGRDISDPQNQGSSALYVQYSNNLTVTGCTFENIQYDSIQLAHKSDGVTTVIGNNFSNTDGYKGYIARAMNLNGVNRNAVIEENVFKTSNSTKENKYIKAGTEITVGINSWQTLPSVNDFKNVVIDLNKQLIK